MKPERETNYNRLLISGNKLRVGGVEGGGGDGVAWRWTLGRVCAMESAVNCVSDGSQTCTPETNDTL